MMIPLPMILVYRDRETRRGDEGVRIIMPYGEVERRAMIYY
jgi:hypothetical protein